MDSAVPTDAWRLERRCIALGLPVLGFAGILGFPYLGRDAVHWFPLFLLWAGWLVGVPAWAIARRLKSPSPLERLGFGTTLAIVGLALFQFAALELDVRSWVLAYPLIVLLALVRGGTLPPRFQDDVQPMPRMALAGGFLAFAMALGVMAMLPSFFPARAPVLDEHRKSRCLKLLPDILLHLQAQEEMSHTWPPQLSPAAGVPLRYHLAADAITLALTPPRVPRLAVNCHNMPTFWHLLMAGNALLLARRYLGATGLAGLFPILAVFGEDFGWLVPKLELQMVPSLPTFPSFFWFNPNLPGLAVLMGGLAALGWATSTKYRVPSTESERRDGDTSDANSTAQYSVNTQSVAAQYSANTQSTATRYPANTQNEYTPNANPLKDNSPNANPRNDNSPNTNTTKPCTRYSVLGTPYSVLGTASWTSIAVAVFLLGGAALFKVFIGVQAGFAVAFAWVLCGSANRRTLTGILLGIALFGGMLAILYRHTFEAPNQHFRFEMLAEMRMSWWFVPVVLGFRILGLGELIRIPMWAKREGPLRVALVGLVLTGAIGLFVRISAMLMPGVLGYNNGVWLSVVAKVPMWLLALGAIQRWPLGRTTRIALALLVALVAVRGSWPFVKFQWENPEVATPPHVIAPDDLEVPQWLERYVPPGTVVACDPSFPLSLTALSPYRTPCPQGGEFAYAISFMTSQDHALRVSDADQFWGEWSCGGLPAEYLAKYRVRCVITRADLACPPGIQPVFRNASWAIFAGNSLNSDHAANR